MKNIITAAIAAFITACEPAEMDRTGELPVYKVEVDLYAEADQDVYLEGEGLAEVVIWGALDKSGDFISDDTWECDDVECVAYIGPMPLDYTGNDDPIDSVPMPSSGGTTCEDAPASCDGSDPAPPPPPPPKLRTWIKTKPIWIY